MKFFGGVGHGPRTNQLDFGRSSLDDPGIILRICTADCIKSFLFARWKQYSLSPSSSGMLYYRCVFLRCVLLCEPLRMDARSSESWNSVLGRFRQLLLSSYSRCIDQYEEHIRSERERRTEPTWSFCEYFVLQVLLNFSSVLMHIIKPPPPVGAGGGYMFSGRLSVPLSVRPSVIHVVVLCFRDISSIC